MKTQLTATTGTQIRRTHEGRWRHVDPAGREFGPDYHTKRELLGEQERFLTATGWLRPPAAAAA